MARVLYTAIVADMRNKLNGSVFSKNKSGAYVRTKVTPVNPQSQAQTTARQRLSQFSNGFRNLTAAQVAAWNDLASNNPQGTDIFGNPKYLTGMSLFVKLNSNITIGGGTAITDAPVLTSPCTINLSNFEVTVAASALDTVSMSFTLSGATADNAICVYASAPYPVSQTYNANKYRLITSIPATGASPYNFTYEYNAIFGAPPLGYKVGLYCETVNKLCGVKIRGNEIISIVSED